LSLFDKISAWREKDESTFSPCVPSYLLFVTLWKRTVTFGSALLTLQGAHSFADSLAPEAVKLPALRVNGQAAVAHTQGLEVLGGKYFVTARREDVRPKRALLLRCETTGNDWDVWDITPVDASGALTLLDHPGGIQSDGKRLWIPLAESKRDGRSLIRVFPLAGVVAGQVLKPEFEFTVNDHIGAVAVAPDQGVVFGASWDTERVYIWDLKGRLTRTLTGSELGIRGLGMVMGTNGRAGVAVQDWKFTGDRLFASGLFRAPGSEAILPKSRLMSFVGFLESDFHRRVVTLPPCEGTELSREAMAISDGMVYFLPEDLGATNRLFRVPLADLLKPNGSQ